MRRRWPLLLLLASGLTAAVFALALVAAAIATLARPQAAGWLRLALLGRLEQRGRLDDFRVPELLRVDRL